MLNQSLYVHHVFFWLANQGNAADHAQLLTGIKSLEAIESVKGIHIGIPANTNRGVIDTSYTFSLLLLFETKELQDEYQVDPIHERFVNENKHLWTKVLIYDSVGAF